jgi:hypothetical protein
LSYDTIHGLKREYGCRIPELLALAPKNDPFYKGSALDLKKARWLLSLWETQGCGKGMHLRRMHYRHVVAEGSIKHDGTPYENTEGCWKYLCEVSCAARALRLVEAADFDDHRNPEPYLIEWQGTGEFKPAISEPLSFDFYLPAIDPELKQTWGLDVPAPEAVGYQPDDYEDRPYILEVWIEKTTMNDILIPLCRELDVNLIVAAGMQSWSNAIRLLERCRRHRKSARVFYISDFDPAGDCMPVAVARALEFFLEHYPLPPGCDIKLIPIALTAEQVKGTAGQAPLPRIPIKPTDNRKAGFEALYGEGAVELDALEAIRPGELERLVRRAVAPYLDLTIRARLQKAAQEAGQALTEQWTAHTELITQQLAAIDKEAQQIIDTYRERLEALAEEMQTELAPLRERLEPLQQDLIDAWGEFRPELPSRPEPELQIPDESEWLFDSNRDYMEQLEFYKRRKNGKHHDEEE